MDYVWPFAAFLFFLGLIALRSKPAGQGLAEWLRGDQSRDAAESGRAHRWPVGDPPVAGWADAFARYGFFAAWLLGMVGLVGAGEVDEQLAGFLVPAGLVLAVIGVLLILNHQGAWDRWRQRAFRSWSGRHFGSEGLNATPWVVLVIGLGWMGIGAASLMGAL